MGETKGGGDRREEKRKEYSVRLYSLVLSRPNVSIIKMIRCVGPSLVMEGGGRVLISDSLRGDCVVLCVFRWRNIITIPSFHPTIPPLHYPAWVNMQMSGNVKNDLLCQHGVIRDIS